MVNQLLQRNLQKEFKSYILIDFAHTSKAIIDLFDDMYDLDFSFAIAAVNGNQVIGERVSNYF